MNKTLPVSIGIITYDRLEMLKEAVQSVIGQSFSNFELLIGNDCPEVPVTTEILGVEGESRIKIINHDRNYGEITNMNYLLRYASGEWFTWLADDDLLHPEFLELLYGVVRQHENIPLVGIYSNYTSGFCPTGIFPSELKSVKNKIYFPREFISDYTSRKCHLIGCYGLMKTDVLKKIHGMPSLGNGFSPYSDTLIPIMLAAHGALAWIDAPLVFLRTHSESQSMKSTDIAAYTSAEAEFLDQLKSVCYSGTVSMQPETCISNMLAWFAADELCVLSRDSMLSRYSVIKAFLFHQFKVNLPRLTPEYWVKHSIVLIRLLFSVMFLAPIMRSLASVRYSLFNRSLPNQN